MGDVGREEKREEGDHWPAESTTAPLSSSSLLRHDLKKSQATSLFHSPLDGPSAMPKAIKKIRFFFPPKKESGKWLKKHDVYINPIYPFLRLWVRSLYNNFMALFTSVYKLQNISMRKITVELYAIYCCCSTTAKIFWNWGNDMLEQKLGNMVFHFITPSYTQRILL